MTRAHSMLVASCLAFLALAALAPTVRASEDLDLSYITADAVAAVVLHPKDILASPQLEMLPTEVIGAVGVDYLGVDLAEVDVAIGILGMAELAGGQPGLGAVLHFAKPYDSKAVQAKLGPTTVEAKVDDKTYYKPKNRGGFGYYAPDDKTLVVGTEIQLRSMVAARDVDSQLIKLLKQVDTHRSAVAVLDVASVRPFINLALSQLPQLPDPLNEFLELPQLIEWLSLSIDLREGFAIDVTLAGADAVAAEEIKELVERARTLAKQFVETQLIGQLSTSDSAIDGAMAKYLRRVMFKLLDAVEIKQQDAEVQIALFRGDFMEAVGAVGLAVVMPTLQTAREAARRAQSTNNLRQIGLAMHNHHDAFKRFPPPAIRSKDNKPLLSWRVKILPFVEEMELYKEFHLDEPWDSEHNKKLIERMPDLYASPNVPDEGRTVYLGIAGAGTFFDPKLKDGLSIRQMIDGTSKTAIVVEADPERAVEWIKPDDWDYDPDNPMAGLGHLRPGGFNALFADGSVHFISNAVDPAVLRALFSYAGREVVQLPQ
ncbi:MAG: DUF1559 domain-containing protein [Planctomycetota bacterium]|nr:MAG: DUF1559 domain-containing protein [Planctomycetota bacterium]